MEKVEAKGSLLAQRHLIDDAHHCPHGRPTALVLSRNELDRQFGRVLPWETPSWVTVARPDEQ